MPGFSTHVVKLFPQRNPSAALRLRQGYTSAKTPAELAGLRVLERCKT